MTNENFEKVLAYEQGELTDSEVIDLFKELIKSGLIWNLQGHYQRTANYLIQNGFIV